MTGTVCIVYLLLRQEPDTPPTTMTDVSTTFMGIWYLGLGFGLGLGLGLGLRLGLELGLEFGFGFGLYLRSVAANSFMVFMSSAGDDR